MLADARVLRAYRASLRAAGVPAAAAKTAAPPPAAWPQMPASNLHAPTDRDQGEARRPAAAVSTGGHLSVMVRGAATGILLGVIALAGVFAVSGQFRGDTAQPDTQTRGTVLYPVPQTSAPQSKGPQTSSTTTGARPAPRIADQGCKERADGSVVIRFTVTNGAGSAVVVTNGARKVQFNVRSDVSTPYSAMFINAASCEYKIAVNP